jgi:enterochelin esterase family protein
MVVSCLVAMSLGAIKVNAQTAAETKKENRPAARSNRVPAPRSPEISPDDSVTFRLRAPNAKEVKVAGEWPKGTVDMAKDDSGVWTVTVGPLPAEIYGYGFMVDGLRIADPGNPNLKPMRSPTTSIVEIRGEPPLIHDFQDVPHGTVSLHDYPSKSLGIIRHLRVYTPPGYEKNNSRYPVLYLLHGSGDNEGTWTVLGHAHLILDNLIAQRKARPMIIVMTDGHATLPNSPGATGPVVLFRNVEDFGKDLLNDVMPFVEGRYRIKAEAAYRAIVGLSMGGGQSLNIGLHHAELFSWVGGMSSYVPNPEVAAEVAIDDPKINRKLKLLWFAVGKDDSLLKQSETFDELLKQHDIKHDFIITEGNHSWPVWRRYLAQFAPLLFKN